MGQQEKTNKVEIFSKRLKDQRLRMALTQHELAKKGGFSLGSIGNWESGLSMPTGPNLRKLADTLGVDVAYFLDISSDSTDSGPWTLQQSSPAEMRESASQRQPIGSIKPIHNQIRQVPVRSWTSAGVATDYTEMEDLIDISVPTDCRDPNCFALIVDGDSMEPKYSSGDFVILNPDVEPRNGDVVVARLREEMGVLFKIYHRTEKGIRLSSYNPAFPALDFPRDKFTFIYPVVGMYRKVRR